MAANIESVAAKSKSVVAIFESVVVIFESVVIIATAFRENIIHHHFRILHKKRIRMIC